MDPAKITSPRNPLTPLRCEPGLSRHVTLQCDPGARVDREGVKTGAELCAIVREECVPPAFPAHVGAVDHQVLDPGFQLVLIVYAIERILGIAP